MNLNIIVFIIICLILFMLRNTAVLTCVTVKVIQFLHLLLCLFVVLGPFIIKQKEILAFYIFIILFIMFHWVLANDTCALTLLEQFITGKPSNETFVGRLVKPVYNVTNKHIMAATVCLLVIAIVRWCNLHFCKRS